MSTYVMGLVWPLEMPPGPKAVLVSLADNANDHGECWPSIPYTARRTCQSERTVQRAIQWLEAAGLLKTEQQTGRSTLYLLTPPNLLPLNRPPTRRHPRHRVTRVTRSGEGDTKSGEGCQGVTQNRKEPPLTKNKARTRAGDTPKKQQAAGEPSGRLPDAKTVLAASRPDPAKMAKGPVEIAALMASVKESLK